MWSSSVRWDSADGRKSVRERDGCFHYSLLKLLKFTFLAALAAPLGKTDIQHVQNSHNGKPQRITSTLASVTVISRQIVRLLLSILTKNHW